MRSHGRRRWQHLSVLAATVALVAFLVAHGALANSNTDYTGTWSEVAICTTQACNGEHFPSVWTLTQTGSSISGTVSDNATATGTVSGSTATMTATLGSYTAHLTVTLSADGSTWSGTFNDNKQVSGTTNASRLRRSATQVSCHLIGPDSPNAYFQCTAQVADASGNAQSDIPTGTVSFAISAGGGGGFQGSGICTLAPSQSGPTSFCSVNYLPPPGGIPIGSQPPLTASYSGDSVLAPSSAQPQSGIVTETPAPTTTPSPVPPPTTINIADCPGNTPVDSVTTPAPPTTSTATTANVPLARIADPPTVIAPPIAHTEPGTPKRRRPRLHNGPTSTTPRRPPTRRAQPPCAARRCRDGHSRSDGVEGRGGGLWALGSNRCLPLGRFQRDGSAAGHHQPRSARSQLLLTVTGDHLSRGLTIFERSEHLGAFDAVLAAAALSTGARALVSADTAFGTIAALPHIVPDERGVSTLLSS